MPSVPRRGAWGGCPAELPSAQSRDGRRAMAGLVEGCEDLGCVGAFPHCSPCLRIASLLACSPYPLQARVPGAAPRSRCDVKEGQRNGAGLFPSLDRCGALPCNQVFAQGAGRRRGGVQPVRGGIALSVVLWGFLPTEYLGEHRNLRRSASRCNPPRARVPPLA